MLSGMQSTGNKTISRGRACCKMAKQKTELENLSDFFLEVGLLKRVKRSGWWVAGIENPESVADHSFRTAIIGYVLAKMEKVSVEKVLLMCLFQDVPEARILDLHKVAHRYFDVRAGEISAFKEQLQLLPLDFQKELLQLFNEYQKDLSKEGIVARDADLLECMIQAKEYLELGNKETIEWIGRIEPLLRTKTSREIFKSIKSKKSLNWWNHLKKTER